MTPKMSDAPPPGTRILLVEDEPGLQEALALVLEVEGYEVLRASNGIEGLAHMANAPALIVTDYMMPRMNGVEMIRRIRALPGGAHLPVLLMSAALPDHIDQTQADVFLQKPVGVKQLLQVMTRFLSVA